MVEQAGGGLRQGDGLDLGVDVVPDDHVQLFCGEQVLLAVVAHSTSSIDTLTLTISGCFSNRQACRLR